MSTDTSEKGLESLIMRHMTGTDGFASGATGVVAEAAPAKGGSGWFAGSPTAYDREFAVDSEQLFAFLMATQPEEWAKLGIDYRNKQGMARQMFLTRTEREIALMQEYRTRLTADLVTGKLDVREAAAKLPEPPSDPAAESVADAEHEPIEPGEDEA